MSDKSERLRLNRASGCYSTETETVHANNCTCDFEYEDWYANEEGPDLTLEGIDD